MLNETGDYPSITGICDGLQAAHPRAPIDPAIWADLPLAAQPHLPIVYLDDRQIVRITAERLPVEETGVQTSIEILSAPARI